MIVFGHNNFVIKSFTPDEIGIPQEEGATPVKFEIRQRYAHIFWIPFFPIGKIWAMRQAGDKNLYDIPPNIKAIIQEKVQVKTPWYSYSLLLLAMLGGLVFYVSELQSEQRWEDNFYNNLAETKMLIEYPTTGDYYVLERYESPGEWDHESMILKVNKYDDEKIEFITLYSDLYASTASEDRYQYQDAFDRVEFFAFNPTSIEKEALKQALRQEYTESSDPIEIAPLNGYYKLTQVDRRKLEE